MSLPPATKHISDSPSANAVTSPTDPAFKAKDIERKMRFYGVFEAFRNGKYPTNQQIDETLKYTVENSPIDESQLSGEGKGLIQDVRNIIETLRRLILEKNRDELFQEFLWHTRDVDYSKGNLSDVNSPVGKDQVNQDAQQAAEHFRTLAKLVLTNSEFRKLLKDSTFLSRDILADAASKAGSKLRPSEAEMAGIDEPAPSNSWEGADGQRTGHNDPIPKSREQKKLEEAQLRKEEMKRSVAQEMEERQRRVDGQIDQVDVADVEDAHERLGNVIDGEGAVTSKKNLKDRTWGKVPDHHKERIKDAHKQGMDYLKDKFPEERRQRYIYRMKKVVVEQQRHRDYQDAIEFFLNMLESYGGHARTVGNHGSDKRMAVTNDPAFKEAWRELRTLLERFANNSSMQPILDAVNQIYADAREDEGLRTWFKELDAYVRRVLQEPGYVMTENCDRDGRKVWDDGRQFWDQKYYTHRQNLFDSISAFFKAYADDPMNVEFGNAWKKLTKDLMLDGDGNLKFKPHLWEDVRSVIAPQLLQHIGYVPIPRIEYTDTQLDLVIENLTLEGTNLLPNVLEMEMRNYFKMSPYKGIGNKSDHSIWISFSQIQADLRDVAWYVKKKSGFPKIQDSGLADVLLSGKGISGKIHLKSSERQGSMFEIVEIKVKVDKLKFAIRQAKHSALYTIIKPLAGGLIKKQIAKALQDAIRDGLVQLDAQLVDLRDKMEEAKASDEEGVNRKSVLKDHFSSKSNKSDSGVDVKSDSGKGSFKIVATKENKSLPWSHKDSIVDKQGDRLDVANSGKGWKSPAFDIVGDPQPGVNA